MGTPTPQQRQAHQVVHEPARVDTGMQVAGTRCQLAVCYFVAQGRAAFEIEQQVNRVDQVDAENRL